MTKEYSILVYNAVHFNINVPKALQKYVPHYDLLVSLSKNGIKGTSLFKEVPEEKLLSLYNQGKQQTSGEKDANQIIAKIIYDRLQDDNQIELDEKLKLLGILSRYSEGKTSLINYEETTFEPEPDEEVEYQLFGFEPLDTLINGFIPNNLITLAAQSGNGKTSVLLALVDSIQKEHQDKRIVWVSLEMSSSSVKQRAKHLSLKENSNNILLTGITSLDELEEYCTPDTILVLDYLDLLIQSNSEGLRVALANAYAKLLNMSTKCFLLFNNTQVNRSSNEIGLNSLNESSAKGFYSSYVLALTKKGFSLTNSNYNQVELKIIKNRYGKSDCSVLFDFNYKTLEYTESYSSTTIQYDEETSELLEGLYE
jgi:hypothetical protein